MGRMLGVFDDDNELDRPDLNKCPDCGCYFKQDKCPLCGKVCPEEMRAGNRKAVKPKKKKRGSGSQRVTFVEWYHRWWFIILMLFLIPLVGIILLVTSPHKKGLKIAVIAAAVLYTLFTTFGLGSILTKLFDSPVNTSLSKEEYVTACAEIDPEVFYRSPDTYTDDYVSMTLVITHKFTDVDAYYESGENVTYYVCRDADGGEFEILLRECILDGAKNYMSGDKITIYGEGAGDRTVYDMDYNSYTAPCVNVAYAVLIEDN